MIEQVMVLLQRLGGTAGQDEELLRTISAAAGQALDRRLRRGLTPQDCGEAYPLAAAWLALDWIRGGQGLDGVTALSAGDISVRREAGSSDSGALEKRALELMAPYLRDDGFVFRRVRG